MDISDVISTPARFCRKEPATYYRPVGTPPETEDPAWLTRQIEFEPSSVTSSEPSCPTPDTYGPAPDGLVFHHERGEKIFVKQRRPKQI
jgi:hypothetical protein